MIVGFATDQGGRTSHTAIMARKLGIPSVVGLGDITQQLHTGDYVLLDGHAGILIAAPTDQTLFTYGQLQERHVALAEKLAESEKDSAEKIASWLESKDADYSAALIRRYYVTGIGVPEKKEPK